MTALCGIITELEEGMGSTEKTINDAKLHLRSCQEKVKVTVDIRKGLGEKWEMAKEWVEKIEKEMESADWSSKHSKAIAEARSLITQGKAKEAAAKKLEAEELLAVINKKTNKLKD